VALPRAAISRLEGRANALSPFSWLLASGECLPKWFCLGPVPFQSLPRTEPVSDTLFSPFLWNVARGPDELCSERGYFPQFVCSRFSTFSIFSPTSLRLCFFEPSSVGWPSSEPLSVFFCLTRFLCFPSLISDDDLRSIF